MAYICEQSGSKITVSSFRLFMMYLILSILSSTLIGFIMTWFDRFRVDTFQAVVVNYFVCVLTGWVLVGQFPVPSGFHQTDWFPYAAGISIFFIGGFTIMGMTFQKFGITLTTIMSRMSMIISVIFAIIAYQESVNWAKITGILMAIAAIIFTNLPHENSVAKRKQIKRIFWIFPALVLLGQAIIEIVLQYVEQNVLETSGDPAFVSSIFLFAGTIGLPIILGGIALGKLQFSWRNVIGGIALGVPNYFSIYFLMKALGAGWEGSVVFPINNVAVIALSAIVGGLLIFKEKYSVWNMIGIGMSIASILLIALGK